MDVNLVKHFLATRPQDILRKSLKNCHVQGMDSIMFDDTPGARIRMFVANENHLLWENDLSTGQSLSIAIHPHHCDVRFVCLKGVFCNIFCEKKPGVVFEKYLYQSKILSGKSGFSKMGERCAMRCNFHAMGIGETYDMEADDLHTVLVQKGQTAAWMVYEGAENPNYKPVCYSNRDLSNFDASKLYQPMTYQYLYETLGKVWPEFTKNET